jgi:hypothetical protein
MPATVGMPWHRADHEQHDDHNEHAYPRLPFSHGLTSVLTAMAVFAEPMPQAPSSTAISTAIRRATSSWLSLLQVSTGIRGIYTRGCPGCARTAVRTSSLCESYSDQVD